MSVLRSMDNDRVKSWARLASDPRERRRLSQNRSAGRAGTRVAQAPILLEPAHMTDFPSRRIDNAAARPELPGSAKIVGNGAQPGSSGPQFPDCCHVRHFANESTGDARR